MNSVFNQIYFLLNATYILFYNSEYEQIRNKPISSIQFVFKERLYSLKTIITQIIT